MMSSNSSSFPSVLYNSLNPHFSFQLFLEQLLFHLFFPLPLPYFYLQYGKTFLYAHGLYPLTNIRNLLANWFFPIAFYLLIIISQYLPDRISYGYIVPCCIYLVHRFMVAMKYGTLSSSEYV